MDENVQEKQQEELPEELEPEAFGELFRYTFAGFGLGLLAGWVLDTIGLQRHAVGQWFVRTLAGETESIFEGVYALRKRLAGGPGSLAEAYGWGKVSGIMFPWILDAASRFAGIDVYAVEGFYLAYFYAMSDQIGANIVGFVYMRRRQTGVGSAVRAYVHNPVMVTSLAVILLVPLLLFGARVVGFSPTTQVLTATETFAANLCWLPPLVGLLVERRTRTKAANTMQEKGESRDG